MLLCPNCNHQLTTKTVKTSASGSIDVDMCGSCGGVYFDRGEVNRITKDQARELVSQQDHHTSEADLKKGTHHCPKCGSSLKRYWGESVPNDVYVLRCPACHGAWFQEDDLKRFKQAQSAKIDFYKTWKIPLPSLSTVMLPVALFIVLSGTMWLAIHESEKSQQLRSYAKEIMTAPSEIPDLELNNTTIIFTTKQPARITRAKNYPPCHDQ
jgi:Zn-finger nucleic acid-binding protein